MSLSKLSSRIQLSGCIHWFSLPGFLTGFLVAVCLYHVMVTFFSFGTQWIPSYVLMAIRDGGRMVVMASMVIRYKSYASKRWRQWSNVILLVLCVLVMSMVTSIIVGSSVTQIAVGIKYTLFYFFPFITALFVGTVWGSLKDSVADQSKEQGTRDRWIRQMWKIIVGVIVIGWVRQILKVISPEMFTYIGYGPLGDYVFGQRPPLYYLTGPGGLIRRSGLFSGPNNYGYFLVAMFGLYRYGVKSYVRKKRRKYILRGLFIMTLFATLSRGAILGVLVQIVLISFVAYNAKRRVVIAAIISGFLAVGGLSALKRSSTLAHMKAKRDSMYYVQLQPRGFGLGSSGPSVHSLGGVLPENFFIQLLMDLGIHGFIFWCLAWICVMWSIRQLYLRAGRYRSIVFFLTIGFVGLMVEGLFLHVLEDSMVNYRYFIVRGVTIGYSAVRAKSRANDGIGE